MAFVAKNIYIFVEKSGIISKAKKFKTR